MGSETWQGRAARPRTRRTQEVAGFLILFAMGGMPPHLSAQAPETQPADLPKSGDEIAPQGAAASAAGPEAVQGTPIEVRAYSPSRAQRARESARSLSVIELEETRRSAADLGQVLARTEGLSVRRSGGLGSQARLAMAGLGDEEIRLFVDGVPIEQAGYPFGVVNVPVNLLERVEVHRGVVPIRLGADALGGAIDLITDTGARGPSLSLSYQGGSYDTHRVASTLRVHHQPSGLFVRGDGFFDTTRNDYPIRVDVPAVDGSNRKDTVHRRNDEYQAGSAALEVGVLNRSWARRLSVRGFYGKLEKGLPHNLTMEVPYGEASVRRASTGAVVRFESVKRRDASVHALLSYAHRRIALEDLSSCRYDWYGRCVFDLSPSRGEIGSRPYDQRIVQQGVLARVGASYTPHPWAQFELSSTLMGTRRTGEDRALTAGLTDPLDGRRDLLSVVSGIDHRLDAWNDRVQNVLSFKDYVQIARSEAALFAGGFEALSRNDHRVGVGDGLRVRITPELFVKSSYEWATRFATPDQLFGDGVLVDANLRLRPESSHNLNLALGCDYPNLRIGELRAQVNGFGRLSHDLIVLLPSTGESSYQNVSDVRTLGVEASMGWTSVGRYLKLDANTTWQDLRNVSERGIFASYNGDSLPNRPYLFANLSAVGTAHGWLGIEDELSLFWHGNYVHAFELGWESLGSQAASRPRVPSQFVQTVGLTLLVRAPGRVVSSTLEIDNLTDARVFDFFGVQRPGRTVFAKVSLEI